MTIQSPTLPLWVSKALKRLKQASSPRRIRIGRHSVESLEGGSGSSAEVIVDRSHCLFAEIDAENVPAQHRRDFVELNVRRAAPFEDVGFDVVWFGSHAAAWYWPKSRLPSIEGVSSSRIHWVAEAKLIDRARTDGIYLIQIHDGFLGRCWSNGRLIAERWWPSIPKLGEWSAFSRGAGQAAPIRVPDPSELEVNGGPLGDAATGFSLAAVGSLRPPKVARWSAAAALIAGSFVLSAFLSAAFSAATWRSRVDDASQQADSILDARDAAEQHRERIDALLDLRPPATPSAVLAGLNQALAGRSWAMQSFSIIDRDRVEAIGSVKDGDAAQLVAAVEAVPLFAEASIESLPNSSGLLMLKVRLRERNIAPPAGAAEDR